VACVIRDTNDFVAPSIRRRPEGRQTLHGRRDCFWLPWPWKSHGYRPSRPSIIEFDLFQAKIYDLLVSKELCDVSFSLVHRLFYVHVVLSGP